MREYTEDANEHNSDDTYHARRYFPLLWGPLRRSRSPKVADFGTNRKLVCDFLLVINSNLHHILHRFRDIASNVHSCYIRLPVPLLCLTPPPPDEGVSLGRSP